MSCEVIRLSGLMLAVGILAGCGGGAGGSGGGGGGGNPTTVTFTLKGPAPAAVAAKVGSGAFAAKTLSGETVSITIPSGTTDFALALNCAPYTQNLGTQTSTTKTQVVLEASTEDGSSFATSCPSAVSFGNTGKLTGSVDASAIEGANTIGVAASNGVSTGEFDFFKGSWSNLNESVPSGTDRVAVSGYVYSASNPYGANSVYRLAAVRNFDGVTVPGSLNGGATVELGASDAVTLQPITYKNVPGNYGTPGVWAFYLWNGGGGVWLTNGSASDYPVLPSAATEAGDYYSFSASAYSQSTFGESMQVMANSTTAGAQTITFPAPWTYSGPTAAALPSFTMNYTGFSGKTGVSDGASIGWQTGAGTNNTTVYSYQVLASANYLNGSSTLALPDLSGLPGFLAAPASGTDVAWVADIFQSSKGFLQPSNQLANVASVQNSGTFTVP